MNCEICGSKTIVIDSRSDVDIVVRKRKCIECKHTFYTQEVDLDKNYGKKFITEHLKKYSLKRLEQIK